MVEVGVVVRAQAEMYWLGWLDGLPRQGARDLRQDVPRVEPSEQALAQCAMARAYWVGYCEGSLVLLLDRWPVERLN